MKVKLIADKNKNPLVGNGKIIPIIIGKKKNSPKPPDLTKTNKNSQVIANAKSLFAGKGLPTFDVVLNKPAEVTKSVNPFLTKFTPRPVPAITKPTIYQPKYAKSTPAIDLQAPTLSKVMIDAGKGAVSAGKIAADIGRFIVKTPVSIGLEGPAGLMSLLKKKQIEAKYVPQGKFEKMIFGEEPIEGMFTDVENAQKYIEPIISKVIKDKSTAKGITIGLSSIFVGGLKALDLTPIGGGEKNLIKQLAKSSDELFISKLLRKTGVTENLIKSYTPLISKIKDEKEIAKVVANLDRIMTKTKAIKPIEYSTVETRAYQEDEILNLLENSQAGQRFKVEGETKAISSTFPDWVPEKYRRNSIIQPTVKHIREGTVPVKKAEQELYELIRSKFDDLDESKRVPTKEFNIDDIDFGLGSKTTAVITPENQKLLNAIKTEIETKMAKVKTLVKNEEALKTATGKILNEAANKWQKVIRKIELANLKAGINLRAVKDNLITRLKTSIANRDSIKKEIVAYAKQALPKETQGKLLSTVAKAKTQKDLSKAMIRIAEIADQIDKRQMIVKLEKILDRTDELPVHWQKKIINDLNRYNFSTMRPETKARLEKLREFLLANEETKFKFGQKTLKKKFYKIADLNKKDIKKMSLNEIEAIFNKSEKNFLEGKLATKIKQDTKNLKISKTLDNLASGSVNLDRQVNKIIAKKPTGKEKYTSVKEAFKANSDDFFTALASPDVKFEVMDGGKRFGINYKTFKEPVDKQYWQAREMADYYTNKYINTKKAIEKKYKTKFNLDNYERITLYGNRQMLGGIEKMEKSGLFSKISREEVMAIELTPAEKELYQEMRSIYDELFAPINETSKKVYEVELEMMDNYMPWRTDFDDSEILANKLNSDFNIRRNKTNQNFTKERLGGKQNILLDAEEVLSKHISDAAIYSNLEETLQTLKTIANNDKYAKAVGLKGREFVLNWIDILARNGKPKNYDNNIIRKMLRNIGHGILGFKLTTIAKQPIAKFNSIAFLGKDAFNYDREFFMHGLSNKVKTFSKQQRFRNIDDPLYHELAKGKYLKNWQKTGYYIMKKADSITADSVWYAAYRKYFKDNKLAFKLDDFKNGIGSQEAADFADFIVRRTQGTGEFKDLPSIIRDRKAASLFFQFQSFSLNEAQIWTYEMKEAIKNRNINKAMAILSAFALTTASEEAVTYVYTEMLGSKSDKKYQEQEGILRRIIMGAADKFPILNSLISSMRFGGTGAPVIDTVVKTNQSIKDIVIGSKKTREKAIIRTIGQTGEMLGISGSSQFMKIALNRTENKKNKKKVKKIY